MSSDNFSRDFLQGKIDCRDGKPHRAGMSEAYDSGYNTQATLERVNDAITNMQFNKMMENEK